MVGDDVRLTRCTTCDAEHEYKHARVPRQRRKPETPAALYSQVAAAAPKVVTHEPAADVLAEPQASAPDFSTEASPSSNGAHASFAPMSAAPEGTDDVERDEPAESEDALEARTEIDGPAHRRLIRAQLPRLDGQTPTARPGPDFTIRQPPAGGRLNRFRPRHQRGGQPPFGSGMNGNGPMRAGSRQPARRSPQMPRPPKRRGSGRKRSK
jgi:hypothetical protein